MARGSGSASDETSFKADKSAIIQNEADAPVERKDQWLKRLKKEEEAQKKNNVITEEFIEVIGKKVLHRFKKENGGGYSLYLFNNRRQPAEWANLLAGGGIKLLRDGKEVFVSLKYVDGRPFKTKGA